MQPLLQIQGRINQKCKKRLGELNVREAFELFLRGAVQKNLQIKADNKAAEVIPLDDWKLY